MLFNVQMLTVLKSILKYYKFHCLKKISITYNWTELSTVHNVNESTFKMWTWKTINVIN